MAELGTLVTIADRVFQVLQSPILQAMKDFKSELAELNQTISSIKNMLLDADKKTDFTNEDQGWIDQLREVLYDADDLFDEVVTLAKRKEVSSDGAELSDEMISSKVGHFFSSKNHLFVSYNTSHEVKSIRQKLADIARDHERGVFKVDSQATRKRRVEACSFLDEFNDGKLIGRDNDVKKLINMVHDTSNVEDNNAGFIVVVGVGGLGKTALAQHLINHKSVKSEFEVKMLWVSVSDQDGKKFDMKKILSNIIETAIDPMPSDVYTMEEIWWKLQFHLGNKKYFLVLDNVWTEDPNEWKELRKYLMFGAPGSKILVTTRSEKTADMVLGRRDHPNKYQLGGLSENDAWVLFKLTAFERGLQQINDDELVKVGKKILKKCPNIPLAIKVLGTFLHTLDTSTWRSFEESRLWDVGNDKNSIMSILKLSYNHLEPSLKSCFNYCALFPKEFKFEKESMISLWMAQDYIVPLIENQTTDNAVEDQFMMLLKRCFLQELEKSELGEVSSFKIHDLMHDMAQEMVGNEIGANNSTQGNLHHLFIDEGKWWTKSCINESKIRSFYMNVEVDKQLVKKLPEKWACLRTLKLQLLNWESLTDSINKLLHLRFLDLSHSSELKSLPSKITQLYNLKTLILEGCAKLMEWPEEFGKLVNLRHLDISDCDSLTCMPLGIGRLVELRVLTHFILVDVDSSGRLAVEQLKDLKALVNLRGSIHIMFKGEILSVSPTTENGWEGGCLEGIESLKRVSICEVNEALIEWLLPHHNVQYLDLWNYKELEIPRWGRVQDDWAILLPNLVTINLSLFQRLKHLPLLRGLNHLRSLTLDCLNDIEYIEDGSNIYSGSRDEELTFFPSLESLQVKYSYKLKGWWKPVEVSADTDWQPSFPRLSKLSIWWCYDLTSFPHCPSLEIVHLIKNNKKLRIRTGSNSSDSVASQKKLNVNVDEACYLLSVSPSHPISNLEIDYGEMENLEEFKEVFKTSCSALRSLILSQCDKLTSLKGGGLEDCTVLETLSLEVCSELRLPFDYDDDGMPWRGLWHNLRNLKLYYVGMEHLPVSMEYLTSLRNLTIEECVNLQSLPEWLWCLSSLCYLKIESCPSITSFPVVVPQLQKLEIIDCPKLLDACQESSGKDWPNIQHIPYIDIYNSRDRFDLGDSV